MRNTRDVNVIITSYGAPIKTPEFDHNTAAVLFSKCTFISYECEAKMCILTNISWILSGHRQIDLNKLDCEIAFLRKNRNLIRLSRLILKPS